MIIHHESKGTLITLSMVLFLMLIVMYFLKAPIVVLLSASIFAFGLLLFIGFFFRKPLRVLPEKQENVIYAPCDGKVVIVGEVDEPEYFKSKCLQIAVFMSPFNVHINWYPISGKIDYYKYHPGKYLVAWHPKSSTKNERTTIVINTGQEKILVRQIAGAVARRIVCYAKNHDTAEQNSELGFIKFGSRMDIFLPLSAKSVVKVGDKVVGTQTILATL